MKHYRTFSSRETQALGETIALDIKKRDTKKKSESAKRKSVKRKKGLGGTAAGHAAVFALMGDLGAGKTTFTQGFLKGFGFRKRVQSPTFVIMRRHGRVFHIDAYRLKKAEQMSVLGFDEILRDPRNVILIEWPERIKEILPKHARWILFRHGKKENERIIIVK
jgi:tRNA threonylcarbamoyladenosine biosynthesis protein TsaE